MQKKWLIVSIVSGVVVASCVFTFVKNKQSKDQIPQAEEVMQQETSGVKEDTGSSQKLNENNPVNVKFEELSYNNDNKISENKNIEIDIKIQYPVIENKNNSEFIKKINDDNKSSAKKDFEDQKKSFDEILEMHKSDDTNESLSLNLIYNTEYSIAKNKDGILSFKVYSGYSTGGVFNSIAMSKNYDLKNQKELKIQDVIKGNSNDIKEMIKKEVIKYYSNAKEDPNNPDLKEHFEDFKRNLEENFKEYDLKNCNFHLIDNSIVFDFSKYELGIGALGAPSVEVPYDSIKSEYKMEILIS